MRVEIIGHANQVANNLGLGFLGKARENSLGIEMTHAGLAVEQQNTIKSVPAYQIWAARNRSQMHCERLLISVFIGVHRRLCSE
ncbi:MAG: hypothetical protein IIA40_14525 [SAR324 cluster bacterium]|nr:hypothetical protein [SAR324 cluster bacterium]